MVTHDSTLVSLDCPGWVMVGWVAPLVPLLTVLWTVALLEALLLGSHTWQLVSIMVFQVLWLCYGSHLVMMGWVASLVVIADDAASTELSSLFCKLYLCAWHDIVCAFYVLYVCFSCVYTCPRVSNYEWMNEWTGSHIRLLLYHSICL